MTNEEESSRHRLGADGAGAWNLSPGYCWSTLKSRKLCVAYAVAEGPGHRESEATPTTVSRGNRMTNSIRPFAAHDIRRAILWRESINGATSSTLCGASLHYLR